MTMRYDHPMMADHVAAQGNLVAHMNDLRQQAINVLNSLAEIWTEHGSNAYQVCHHQVASPGSVVQASHNCSGVAGTSRVITSGSVISAACVRVRGRRTHRQGRPTARSRNRSGRPASRRSGAVAHGATGA